MNMFIYAVFFGELAPLNLTKHFILHITVGPCFLLKLGGNRDTFCPIIRMIHVLGQACQDTIILSDEPKIV